MPNDADRPDSVTYSVSVGHALLRQCGKPSGWFGRLQLWRMNRSHASLTDWALTHVSVGAADTIVDIGCGGGRTVGKLAAAAPNGRTYGIDYSDTSVAASMKANRALISSGRVEIRQASVSQLPFPDCVFDLATAIETHYYWPNLKADLAEILRVLKPGGALMIAAEAYKGGKYDRVLRRLEMLQQRGIMNYAHLTVSEHRDLLTAAGYRDVQVLEAFDRGWLCAIGRR